MDHLEEENKAKTKKTTIHQRKEVNFGVYEKHQKCA